MEHRADFCVLLIAPGQTVTCKTALYIFIYIPGFLKTGLAKIAIQLILLVGNLKQ